MHRLFCHSGDISVSKISIDDKEQVHHARDVLRLKENENVAISDGKGNEYLCSLEGVSSKGMVFNILSKRNVPPPAVKISVGCAIPKGPRMDDIIDKLTQLGVSRIIPLETERVVVKLSREKKYMKQKRWEKIAFSASLQSQRNVLPVVDTVKKLGELLTEAAGFDLKLIPTLSGNRIGLKCALEKIKPKSVLVLIGPEGDFTPGEVRASQKAGFIPVSLGELVLRVDTAASAAAAFIRFYYDPQYGNS
ncbi:MAG: RsmE family RNA methyltransferase [Candidatus Omnitrophica bacterium]|nr:RsmE family RNA methyltransferase [Candidatus Omnitrophota bacterium]MDD5552984.1 RsmE family RNA methyltransferase [Candidatus Omnitrophota bacterium]